eukprot:TRINITY_DN97335_c0_g1_i1.p2 TRINITY_DN97335_c0_g1~~TRINITY_DN97335_c0_g1_i1.p2  ORF type:complete len:129 (+),score=4.20 TRINITY_DN97335_c0_g1_i1:40-426(+)
MLSQRTKLALPGPSPIPHVKMSISRKRISATFAAEPKVVIDEGPAGWDLNSIAPGIANPTYTKCLDWPTIVVIPRKSVVMQMAWADTPKRKKLMRALISCRAYQSWRFSAPLFPNNRRLSVWTAPGTE